MERKRSALMLVSFLAYYVILFAERVYSLVYSFQNVGFNQMFNGPRFNLYVYGMTILSVGIFLLLFLRILGKLLSVGIVSSSGLLIFDAAVLLVAGMLHTEGTFLPIQFIAYIFLLIGCLTRFLEIMRKEERYGSVIAAFVYFAAFSMAIPTVEKTSVGNTNMKLYYLMGLGSLALILVFTIMMLFLFSEERYNHVTNPIFLGIMVVIVGALAIFALTGNSSDINLFSSGAAVLAVLAYLVMLLLKLKERKARIL